jgi:hypothetical protein
MIFYTKSFNVTADYSSLQSSEEKTKFEDQFKKLFQNPDFELKMEWGNLLSISMSFEEDNDGSDIIDNIEKLVDILILFGMSNIKGNAEAKKRRYNFTTVNGKTVIQTESVYDRRRIELALKDE